MPRRKKESSGHWLEPRSDESVVWSWGFLEGCAGHPPSLLLLPYLLPHPTLPAVVCTLLPLSLGPPPLFLPLRFLLPQSPLSWNYSFLSSLLLRKPSAYRHLFRALLFLFITSQYNWAGLCGASRGRPLPRTLYFSSSLKYPHSSTWCSFLHHSLLSGGWRYCAGPADPALVQ